MIPKILLVDYGVANNFGSHIEINRELLNYPDLYDYVVKHELSHLQEKSYKLHDLKADFSISPKMFLKLIGFVIIRPKTWIDFLPIYKRAGRWTYDKGMILSYSILIILSMIFAWVFAHDMLF